MLNKKTSVKISRKLILLIVLFVMIVIISILVIPKLNKNTSNDFYSELKAKGFKDLGESFICDDIKNNDLMMTTRKYSIIAIKGQVYNISFNTKYQNGQNCEKRDFKTKVVSHLDNYVVGENGKYYSIYENLAEREDIKYSYDTKDIVQKADKYILKKDGNIYYEKDSKDKKIEDVKYSAKSLDGKIQSMSIVNSDYAEYDERKIVVMTTKAIYHSYDDNEEKCRLYADVKCNYQLVKDEFLSKHRKKILYIDDTILITKDGKVIYIADNYFDERRAQ